VQRHQDDPRLRRARSRLTPGQKEQLIRTRTAEAQRLVQIHYPHERRYLELFTRILIANAHYQAWDFYQSGGATWVGVLKQWWRLESTRRYVGFGYYRGNITVRARIRQGPLAGEWLFPVDSHGRMAVTWKQPNQEQFLYIEELPSIGARTPLEVLTAVIREVLGRGRHK
jgi:hypothetical protein